MANSRSNVHVGVFSFDAIIYNNFIFPGGEF